MKKQIFGIRRFKYATGLLVLSSLTFLGATHSAEASEVQNGVIETPNYNDIIGVKDNASYENSGSWTVTENIKKEKGTWTKTKRVIENPNGGAPIIEEAGSWKPSRLAEM